MKLFYKILAIILFCFTAYEVGYYIQVKSELRQLTKEKLRLEIQLLKIKIELNEINLQKEY